VGRTSWEGGSGDWTRFTFGPERAPAESQFENLECQNAESGGARSGSKLRRTQFPLLPSQLVQSTWALMRFPTCSKFQSLFSLVLTFAGLSGANSSFCLFRLLREYLNEVDQRLRSFLQTPS
jgi:hypothetical protein